MLKVRIYSFGYKKSGIPQDETSNCGGFVFDCRFIYNPGRISEFAGLTGKDKEVIDFLDDQPDMVLFLSHVYSVMDKAVENYVERDFTDIMVSFGCTGGQHRSVYAAEKLKQHLASKYDGRLIVILSHKEFPLL